MANISSRLVDGWIDLKTTFPNGASRRLALQTFQGHRLKIAKPFFYSFITQTARPNSPRGLVFATWEFAQRLLKICSSNGKEFLMRPAKESVWGVRKRETGYPTPRLPHAPRIKNRFPFPKKRRLSPRRKYESSHISTAARLRIEGRSAISTRQEGLAWTLPLPAR